MIKCAHCQREDQQVKIGFNRSGSQRYRCKVCQRKYTPVAKAHGYGAAVRKQAIQQVVDGVNYRRIGRTLGIDHQTVANWAAAHSDSLPDRPPVPDGEVAVSELDEVFTFIGAKKTKSTS
jgi:transposase